MNEKGKLSGPREVVDMKSALYPESLRLSRNPPDKLYVVGSVEALQPGLAVIGARKATPYGLTCARRFSRIAAEKGIVIISGGARGCDAEAHWAALHAGGTTVAFLGGGCDQVYPPEHWGLFQQIVDQGGAVVSEHHWTRHPLRYAFRERNRLIAGLAAAVLIVEAGLPSGTFSTADEALDAGKEVLIVPGAITSENSRGSNRLLYQGAIPIVDDDSFEDALFRACGALKRPQIANDECAGADNPVLQAVLAEPIAPDDLLQVAMCLYGQEDARAKLMELLVQAEMAGIVARQPDGKWGPVVHT